MNEKFKEYTEKGFEFLISVTKDEGFVVEVLCTEEPLELCEVYYGDNLDHAFAACDLWLEGGE